MRSLHGLMLLGLLAMLAGCGEPPVQSSTPVPTIVPFPTRPPFAGRGPETATTVLHVAETLLSIDLAVHPTESWPVVAAVAAPLVTHGDPHALVRVFDPHARRWRDAVSLGAGESGLARTRFRTARVGVAGDGTITAVWGATYAPRLGLQASVSADQGATWSAAQPIASNTYGVLDLAVAPDGRAAALAVSEIHQRPLLIRRTRDGRWQPPEVIPVPAWYGSTGAIEILGDGEKTRIVVVTSGGGVSSLDTTLFLVSRRFDGGAWRIERRNVASPDSAPGGLLTKMRAVSMGDDGLLASFAMAGRPVVFTIGTVEGGQSWGETEMAARGGGEVAPISAPAYDAQADAAVVFWVCCGDAGFVGAESTHYAGWGRPGSGEWHPRPGLPGAPLVSGAIAASDTVAAQARNGRLVWLAWVEQVHQVRVRMIDLARVIPPDAYPTPALEARP